MQLDLVLLLLHAMDTVEVVAPTYSLPDLDPSLAGHHEEEPLHAIHHVAMNGVAVDVAVDADANDSCQQPRQH